MWKVLRWFKVVCQTPPPAASPAHRPWRRRASESPRAPPAPSPARLQFVIITEKTFFIQKIKFLQFTCPLGQLLLLLLQHLLLLHQLLLGRGEGSLEVNCWTLCKLNTFVHYHYTTMKQFSQARVSTLAVANSSSRFFKASSLATIFSWGAPRWSMVQLCRKKYQQQ